MHPQTGAHTVSLGFNHDQSSHLIFFYAWLRFMLCLFFLKQQKPVVATKWEFSYKCRKSTLLRDNVILSEKQGPSVCWISDLEDEFEQKKSYVSCMLVYVSCRCWLCSLCDFQPLPFSCRPLYSTTMINLSLCFTGFRDKEEVVSSTTPGHAQITTVQCLGTCVFVDRVLRLFGLMCYV